MIKKLLDLIPHIRKDKDRHVMPADIVANECRRAIWYEYYEYPIEPYLSRQNYINDINNLICAHFKAALSAHANIKTILMSQKLKAKIHILDETKVLHLISLNQSDFKKCERYGIEIALENVFKDVQVLMGIANLEEAHILMINRNDCHIHEEVIKFNETIYECLLSRLNEIIESSEPPKRISNMRSYYICKNCQFNTICFDVNARTS